MLSANKGAVRIGWRAAAQSGLIGARLAQSFQQRAAEIVDVLSATVGERVRGGMPGGFDGVGLRGIGGEPLQIQPRVFAQQLAQGPRIVDGGAVPHHDHVAAQMAQQIRERIVDLLLRYILRMHPKVEPQSPSLGAHRQPANHRDASTTVIVANDRRLPDSCPGAPYWRNHHEAGFVAKDDVGTQPRNVFFTCGHRVRSHCSIFCSSRSSARRSGFWQLNPSSCNSRAT